MAPQVMGRQTAVAMTHVDEAEFLAFLRETADIQLLESFAPTKEEIFVTQFSPRRQGHWVYNIWNKAFDWEIEYGKVGDDVNSEFAGWYYVSNTHRAPVIEYVRHNFEDGTGLSYGRVYWSRYFTAQPEDLHYDVSAFSAWYDQIVRWIRKHGKQKKKGPHNTYFLPDALKR